MHERTRRYVCRLLFVACALLPTTIVAGWCAYRQSSWYAAHQRSVWEATLFQWTGMQATIVNVRRTPEATTLLESVKFVDPDSQIDVASFRVVEIATLPQGIVARLSQPEIGKGQFLRLWDLLHERILKGQSPPLPVQIMTAELTLHADQQSQTFTEVHCTLQPRETGLQAVIDFKLAGLSMPAPARVVIDRNRQTAPPTTRWEVFSQTPIPCSPFADYLPGLAGLGDGSLYRGSVWMTQDRAGWTGSLQGDFLNVDLDRVLDGFPHKLSGLANIFIQRAEFRHGRVDEFDGVLQAGGGVVARSLLESLVVHLPIRTMRELDQSIPLLPYRELCLAFRMDADGLRLAGKCQSSQADVVLTDEFGSLLVNTNSAPISAVAMVRALSPTSDWQVPMTSETNMLVRVLPLPTTTSSGTSISRQPGSRLRLSEPIRQQ